MAETPKDSYRTLQAIGKCRVSVEAFNELFDRHRHTLKVAVGLRMTNSLRARFDESDVVQETYAEAFRRFDDYLAREPMPFRLWLRKTAIERLAMLRRKHIGAEQRSIAREQKLPDGSTAQLARNFVAEGPSPSGVAGASERADQVRRAISNLAATDQEILLMRNHEGLQYEEIAKLLEIEVAAARKRYGRALVRLQQLLEGDGMSESQL